MKNIIFLIFASLMTATTMDAQWSWLEQHTPVSGESRYYHAVTTDANNDIYSVGTLNSFSGTACIGGMLISKRQPDGTLVYERTYVINNGSGICDEAGWDLVVDETSGQLVIVGKENGAAFLGFFDSSTGLLNQKATLSGGLTLHSVALQNNQVYVVGRFTGSVNIGGTTLTSTGGSNGFIAVFDTNTNLQQILYIHSTQVFEVQDIRVDQIGDMYVSCITRGDITFDNVGNDTYTKGTGLVDLVIFKLDTQFDLSWSSKIGTSSIYFSHSSDYRFPLELQGTNVFGASTYNQGARQTRLAKVDSASGTLLASDTTAPLQVSYDIAINCDQLHLTGWNITRKPCGSIMFYSQHDLNDLSQTYVDYSSQCGVGKGIHADQLGNIVLVGVYNSSSFSIGSNSITGAPYGVDAYIAKYAASSNCCPNNLALTSPSDDIFTTDIHEVEQFIEADNTVFSGANTIYKAGDYILLKPNFVAEYGSVFHAYIEDCTTEGGLAGGFVVPKQRSSGTNMEVGTTDTKIKTYPNPFSYATTVEYELVKAANVSLSIYDVQGRVIKVLMSATEQKTGIYKVKMERENLPSGLYYYKLQIDEQVFSNKIVLID